MSPEHEELRSSILEDALTIIDLIKIPNSPFYADLQQTAVDLLANENVIRAYVQEKGERHVAQNIGAILSNRENALALLAILGAAKQTFHRAGLVPLSVDSAEDMAVR
jgi:hypothetical protein